MPPAGFIAKVIGTRVGATFSFAVPAQTKRGDTFVMIVGCEAALTTFLAAANPDVDFVDSADVVNGRIHVVRRIAEDTDPPILSIVGDAAPAWALSVLLVYRGLKAQASVSMSGSQIAATTNFACPSRTLAAYSDLYLGVALVTTAATAVVPPAGTTELHEEQAGGRTLEVFELLAELAGATGAKTATTGANQSGGAASVALAAQDVLPASAIVPDVPGAIGLVEVGV